MRVNGNVTACGLCDSDKLAPNLVSGMRRCLRCGAWNVEHHTDATHPNPYASQELADHRAEDAAALSDMLAAEGTGIDRSYGG